MITELSTIFEDMAGLSISKSIIEAHGGKVCAQNNTDGRDLTFSFTISQNGTLENNYFTISLLLLFPFNTKC
jgi:light-regulated signal transduction histidine kinase (bacteriophytochrome)